MRQFAWVGLFLAGVATGQDRLPDWLVDPTPFVATTTSTTERIVLANGLIRREFTVTPNAATVAIDLVPSNTSLLRTVKPEARLTLDGVEVLVGALTAPPIGNYLDPSWLGRLESVAGSLVYKAHREGPITARFAWKPRYEWLSRPTAWPPKGRHLEIDYAGYGTWGGLTVTVHHECYDGIPLLAKWLTLSNGTGRAIRVEGVTSEILGFVEAESDVETPDRMRIPAVHVESDATGFIRKDDPWRKPAVRWLPDPTYRTQVNYSLSVPCLLESSIPFGPDVTVADGGVFESHRTWILPFDQDDVTRKSLSLAEFYRTIAPWVQENPLIFHSSRSDPEGVRDAIDQASSVGFEMVIMTFGSGFDAESKSAEYRSKFKDLAAYAHSKQIALGGYSLLASRSVDADTDVIDPRTGKPGAAFFGASPCLGSVWGRNYIGSLKRFFGEAALDVLEHDGSYPGDLCGSTSHPGHEGHRDSYWKQRQAIIDFYRWCRSEGIYLNVPDWYFLNGASKTGMGYRETNWSLPRAYQEIIERQNIVDGIRTKAPTMGWMFVPLMEYQGGGPAATIEPLALHLDHYRRRFRNLLGAGVQACWRGPRLFDTAETKTMVSSEVAWFKRHRRILEANLITLRRADGRDVDGWIHVDPSGEERALARIFNPLDVAVERTIVFPLTMAGLTDAARLAIDDGPWNLRSIERDGTMRVRLVIPARGDATCIWRSR